MRTLLHERAVTFAPFRVPAPSLVQRYVARQIVVEPPGFDPDRIAAELAPGAGYMAAPIAIRSQCIHQGGARSGAKGVHGSVRRKGGSATDALHLDGSTVLPHQGKVRTLFRWK